MFLGVALKKTSAPKRFALPRLWVKVKVILEAENEWRFVFYYNQVYMKRSTQPHNGAGDIFFQVFSEKSTSNKPHKKNQYVPFIFLA